HVIHYTPKHGSWLNQIAIWFGVLPRRGIRRGNCCSKADLTRRLLAYIVYYNEHLAHPYPWTYTGQPLGAYYPGNKDIQYPFENRPPYLRCFLILYWNRLLLDDVEALDH